METKMSHLAHRVIQSVTPDPVGLSQPNTSGNMSIPSTTAQRSSKKRQSDDIEFQKPLVRTQMSNVVAGAKPSDDGLNTKRVWAHAHNLHHTHRTHHIHHPHQLCLRLKHLHHHKPTTPPLSTAWAFSASELHKDAVRFWWSQIIFVCTHPFRVILVAGSLLHSKPTSVLLELKCAIYYLFCKITRLQLLSGPVFWWLLDCCAFYFEN